MYKINQLFDLDKTICKEHLNNYEYPWEVIDNIKNIIVDLSKNLPTDYQEIQPNVWVHKTAKISDKAIIVGPAIIGKDSELRVGAFVRENVIIGESCVVGNSCEIKNAILFNECQVPHFNYVGDSLLGYKAHLGAGAIISNLKSDKSQVVVKDEDKQYETNLKKFGAILADNVEVGCNSVLNPGTIIGKNSSIYPLSRVRGIINENSIYKDEDNIIEKND